MKGIWLAAVVLLLAACGIQPSGVTGAGRAPTGVAPGVTLYFVDGHGALEPRVRRTGRLGTIPGALALLLAGPGGSGLRTGIASTDVTWVGVDVRPGLIRLRVPLAAGEATPRGIDQIVCTALAAHVQGGGSTATKVQVRFTTSGPESAARRTCPLIG